MDWAAQRIYNKTGIRTSVIKGYTNASGNTDSTAYALIAKHQASHAIVIHSFDVFFYQTNVEVTQNYDGKKDRRAFMILKPISVILLYNRFTDQ
ncbi:MAG: hypothetical protein IPH18_07450 [Chitinophagaceae bacterium]|nr:hypothetical protein [Chitinophagaceae bacterium]